MLTTIFFVLSCSVLLTYCGIFNGRPLVEITDITLCDDFQNVDIISALTVRSYNKSMQYISGYMEFNEVYDSTYKMKIFVYRLINNKWKKDMDFEKDYPCEALKLVLGPIYLRVLKMANVKKCPLQPGRYTINDFPFDGTSIPLIYATGQFMVKVHISKKPRTLKFCELFYANISLA